MIHSEKKMHVPIKGETMNYNSYYFHSEDECPDLDTIYYELLKNFELLSAFPTQVIVKIFSKLGKLIVNDTSLRKKEGMYYLALWLRESNLLKYLDINFNMKDVFEKEIKIDKATYMIVKPRGVCVHWMAGNVPTISAFSLVQSVICKNTNILKVSSEHIEDMILLFEKLSEISIKYNDNIFRGEDLLKTMAFVSFTHRDLNNSKKLSLMADCKIIWGGEDALEGVISLPQKESCEIVIFGPKYSFAVTDTDSINERGFDAFKKFALDIIGFDQSACSSPHVLFIESNSEESFNRGIHYLKAALKEITIKYPKLVKEPSILSNIINWRGRYLLSEEKEIICSKELDWTILINDEIKLEEPIGSRTIFVKKINTIDEIVPLITKKVQTIGANIIDMRKLLNFSNDVILKGVARVVPFGEMNYYDTPWDGLLFLNRLVRYAIVKGE